MSAAEQLHVHEAHEPLRPHPEHVVLDIGGGLGALVVRTGAALHGREIEISPAGADGQRSHKDVLARPIGDRTTYAAVFDRLPAGRYTLWSAGMPCERDVTVAGGQVRELDWTQ